MVFLIDGVKVASPDAPLTFGIQDISKRTRNANGRMVGDIIATKRKIECKWTLIDSDSASQILNLVNQAEFSVTYNDPQENAVITKLFYSGDRKVSCIQFDNGKMMYKDLSVNLIEV